MPSKLHEHKRALAIVRKYFPNVEEIEEGTEPLRVEVTKRDSSSAAVRNHDACAMAVACKRQAKADGVIVSIQTSYVIKGTVATRYKVPNAVQREIVSFDRDAGFAPGEYELVPFEPSGRLGVRQAPTGPHKVTGKPKQFQHHTAGIRAVLGSKES
jgi:hypothetical protein